MPSGVKTLLSEWNSVGTHKVHLGTPTHALPHGSPAFKTTLQDARIHVFGLYTKTLISAVNHALQGVPLFPPNGDLHAQPIFHFPFQMYVDAAIGITEGETSLQLVNAELTKASSLWRCKFAGGKKGPRVVPLMPTHGPPSLTAFDGGKLCGHMPTCVDQITRLGILIDDELSFEPLVNKAVAEIQAIGLPAVPSSNSATLQHGHLTLPLVSLQRNSGSTTHNQAQGTHIK